MHNLILELKNIVDEGRENGLKPEVIRMHLKEYLQYFILEFIYNSDYKSLIFFGGTCLRIVYELPRMSEDLDFEVVKKFDFEKFTHDLKKYFQSIIRIKPVKVKSNKEKSIWRIVLCFPVISEIGFSGHKTETLKIKVEIHPVTGEYLANTNILQTPISKYGKVFILHHYDPPTLMAGKMGATLQRTEKGFHIGDKEEGINFKGRDFYDLLWYMQQGIIPNQKVLKANGFGDSPEKVFDKIQKKIFAVKPQGIKKDIENLFDNQRYVENWIENFQEIFERLKKEKYSSKN